MNSQLAGMLRVKWVVVLIALLLSVVGCKDNFDIRLLRGGALVCITIGAKNADTEAELDEQIEGINPPPTRKERKRNRDFGGFNVWALKFQVNFKPSIATEDTTIHFGIELADGAEWTRLETDVEYADSTHAFLPSPPAVEAAFHPGFGRALEVVNPSPVAGMRIGNLEVTLSNTDVPLADLNYHDPQVAALPWYQVIVTETTFAPLESRIYDIPDEPALSSGNNFMRALYTDVLGTTPFLGAVQELLASQVTDAIAEAAAARRDTGIRSLTLSPVPVTPNATLRGTFQLTREARVVVDLFEVNGRHVATILNEIRSVGDNVFTWRPRRLPTGTYVMRVAVDGGREAKSTKFTVVGTSGSR